MDLNGGNAGAIAAAAMAAWAGATAFWMGVGAVIWRLFFEPRIKSMQAQLDDERKRCDREIEDMRDRIKQLELLLLLHGPQALRQQMQAALSEQHVELDAVREGRKE
jgi:hypothetical protein